MSEAKKPCELLPKRHSLHFGPRPSESRISGEASPTRATCRLKGGATTIHLFFWAIAALMSSDYHHLVDIA